MKVRLLMSISGDQQLSGGQIVDLDEMTAKYYILHGKAELVNELDVKAERIIPPRFEKAVKTPSQNQKLKR